MKKLCSIFAYVSVLLLCLMFPDPSSAHFGMVIPSDDMVMQGDRTTVTLDLMFLHPFEGHGMDLTKPAKFAVLSNGKQKNLVGSLQSRQIQGHQTWQCDFKIKRPGVYTFIMVPHPYWESGEDCYIVHYTKVVVAAFGDDEGWDKEIGLKTEIIPLTRPYGLYAGNVFQGIVKLNGKLIPFAEVEVEYYNKEGKYTAPNDYMVTQTIRADANGVFTYAAPKAGWWGFAALSTSDIKKDHNGKKKDVELGAVIWVHFYEMK